MIELFCDVYFSRCKVVPFPLHHMCPVVHDDVTSRNSYNISIPLFLFSFFPLLLVKGIYVLCYLPKCVGFLVLVLGIYC